MLFLAYSWQDHQQYAQSYSIYDQHMVLCCADPAEYYEHVLPSDWKPEAPETWIELHRRAYCGHADVVFPVLFFAVTGVVCFFNLLSPGMLLAALPVFFIFELQLLVISGSDGQS